MANLCDFCKCSLQKDNAKFISIELTPVEVIPEANIIVPNCCSPCPEVLVSTFICTNCLESFKNCIKEFAKERNKESGISARSGIGAEPD